MGLRPGRCLFRTNGVRPQTMTSWLAPTLATVPCLLPLGMICAKRFGFTPLQAGVSNRRVLEVKTERPRHIAPAFRVLMQSIAATRDSPAVSPLASCSRPETTLAAVRLPKIESSWAKVSVSLFDLRVRIMSQARNCRAPHNPR